MKYSIVFKIIFLIFINFVCSCTKDEEVTPKTESKDYLEIVVSGKKYKNDLLGLGSGFSNQSGCIANKPHFLLFVNTIETSTWSFNVYLSHFENEIDFAKSVPGNFGIQSQVTNVCNLNLSTSFEDKLLTNFRTTLVGSNINNVISVNKKGSINNRTTDYQVKGNFSSSFKNSAGSIIPITGNYQVTI